jgi:predicted nucleic acid-binding protein
MTKDKVVLDASVINAILLGEPSAYAHQIFTQLENQTIQPFAPRLIGDECLNALLKAKYHQRIDAQGFHTRLAILMDLFPLIYLIDSSESQLLFRANICLRHNLRSYDAIYLALAFSFQIPLATLDHRLARAAQQESCYYQI